MIWSHRKVGLFHSLPHVFIVTIIQYTDVKTFRATKMFFSLSKTDLCYLTIIFLDDDQPSCAKCLQGPTLETVPTDFKSYCLRLKKHMNNFTCIDPRRKYLKLYNFFHISCSYQFLLIAVLLRQGCERKVLV